MYEPQCCIKKMAKRQPFLPSGFCNIGVKGSRRNNVAYYPFRLQVIFARSGVGLDPILKITLLWPDRYECPALGRGFRYLLDQMHILSDR